MSHSVVNDGEKRVERTGSLEKNAVEELSPAGSQINLVTYHEDNAGRLVCDPEEAKIEFGEAVASKLKLSKDKQFVLWPQPTDDPEDPQNWSNRQKTIQLIIITLAAIVPDFDSGIGIAGIFKLAEQFETDPGRINNMTSNWSIFLLGWGGIFAVMLMRRLGRLPVLFWSQVLALGFLIGCTFAKDIGTFTAMRCLTAFFGTAPQVTGLYIVTDIYPFHLQARKLNIWTMGFIGAPFISPFLFGFLVAKQSWRWAYGLGCIYGAIVVVVIALFGRETLYDRNLRPVPKPTATGLKLRIQDLVGITGLKMQHHRISWTESILSPFRVLWRPHLLMILIFEAMVFGFGIGINVTNAVFLGHTPVVGFGYSENAISALYATPIVAVIVGELIGRYVNDWIMKTSIRRNKGIFEAEHRLWACYVGIVLFVVGFVTLGATIEKHLSTGALVMGWGISEVAIMITTVAVYAYLNDSFPKNAGEISALVNLARTLGGFSVAYFQIPWAEKHGAIQTFGVEAAICVGLFVLMVPLLQLKGRTLRHRFSMK
jgi:MFS family permease